MFIKFINNDYICIVYNYYDGDDFYYVYSTFKI